MAVLGNVWCDVDRDSVVLIFGWHDSSTAAGAQYLSVLYFQSGRVLVGDAVVK